MKPLRDNYLFLLCIHQYLFSNSSYNLNKALSNDDYWFVLISVAINVRLIIRLYSKEGTAGSFILN